MGFVLIFRFIWLLKVGTISTVLVSPQHALNLSLHWLCQLSGKGFQWHGFARFLFSLASVLTGAYATKVLGSCPRRLAYISQLTQHCYTTVYNNGELHQGLSQPQTLRLPAFELEFYSTISAFLRLTRLTGLQSQVNVILWSTVSRPVYPGFRPPSGTCNQFLFSLSWSNN
jgi:hypothetical protein